MKIAHPKTNIRKTFLVKLCFDFMADNVAIKPGFCQQVAAEAFKFVPKGAKRAVFGSGSHAPRPPQRNFNRQEEPQESLHEMQSH